MRPCGSCHGRPFGVVPAARRHRHAGVLQCLAAHDGCAESTASLAADTGNGHAGAIICSRLIACRAWLRRKLPMATAGTSRQKKSAAGEAGLY